MKFYDCVSKKKKRSLSSLCCQLQNKKAQGLNFQTGETNYFSLLDMKKNRTYVSKYNFKTWMCEFNILYDEKCLIWDTDKILMFEVLPKSRL